MLPQGFFLGAKTVRDLRLVGIYARLRMSADVSAKYSGRSGKLWVDIYAFRVCNWRHVVYLFWSIWSHECR